MSLSLTTRLTAKPYIPTIFAEKAIKKCEKIICITNYRLPPAQPDTEKGRIHYAVKGSKGQPKYTKLTATNKQTKLKPYTGDAVQYT